MGGARGHGEDDYEVGDESGHHGPQRPLGNGLARVLQVPGHGRAGEDTGRGGEQDAKEVAERREAPERRLVRVRQEVVQEGLQAYAGELYPEILVVEGLLEDGRHRDTYDGEREDDNQGVARLGEDAASRQAKRRAGEEGGGLQGVAMPVALGERGADVQTNTVDQTHDVEGRVQDLGEVEQDADRAAELGAQGPRDEVVSAAALDLAIRGDGGQRQSGDEVDEIGGYEQAYGGQNRDGRRGEKRCADLPSIPSKPI